jgi:lipopolysaccharide export system protein LptA
MKNWIPIALLCAAAALAARAAELTLPGPGGETRIDARSLEFFSRDTEARFVFEGDVVVVGNNLRVTCDRMEVVSQREGAPDAPIGKMGRIREIIATGNVVVSQGERRATSGRAELRPVEGVIVLLDNPVLVDPQGMMAGEEITLYRGENRAFVKKPRLTLNQIPDLGPGTKADGAGAKPPQP